MRLFGRGKRRETEQAATTGQPVEIARRLGAEVARAIDEERPPEHVLQALQVGLPFLTQRELSEKAISMGQTAARLGYFGRNAEFDVFDAAREADLELADALNGFLGKREGEAETAYDAMAEFSGSMVLSEIAPRPTQEQGGPLWAVPGVGGDLRLALADNLLADMYGDLPTDISPDDLLAAWKFGFFLRALEEFFLEKGLQH